MLTKKDRKKRFNKSLDDRKGHLFGMGAATKAAFESDFGGAVSGLASAATGAIDVAMKNAELQGVEEAQEEIDQRANFQSAASSNDDLLAEMAGATNAKSDYTHTDFMQSGKDLAMNTINATIQGAASGASAGPFGAIAGAAAGLLGGVGGIIGGRVKAGHEARKKNTAAKKANLAQAQNLSAKAGALDQAADQRALAAYAAYGGGINTPKFPDFPSEITEFNTGGSHEENPYDGIPQGIAPDGLPNLVEEGEVKYDNYIFSDRLMLNKNDKKKYKFLKGKTYADAAKAIKRELGIDERPNDLIAKTDLEEHLNILSTLQEEERVKRGLRGENRMMYKNGGHIVDSMHDILSGLSRKQAIDKLANTTFNYTDDAGITRTWTNPDNRSSAKAYYKSLGLNSGGDWSSLLQAAPAMGSAIGLIANLFDRPTYEHAKELQNGEDKNITPITYTPLTQKMAYKPMDVNYYGNKLAAQAGSTRRAIREQTASNPYASTAALLSADANAQGQLGDLYKKAEEYNLAQREKVDTFNRATDSANAEMSMKAQQLNASLKDSRAKRQLERDSLAARLKMMEDQAWDAANSANMTSLFDNLGAIGKENKTNILASIYNLLKAGQVEAAEQLGKEAYGSNFSLTRTPIVSNKGKKYGGKLCKKKGYTI